MGEMTGRVFDWAAKRLDPVSCYAIYPCQLFEGWLTVCNSERQNVNGWNERKSLTGQHQAVLTRLDPEGPATQFLFLAIAKLFHPECGSITPKQYFLKERKMAKAKTFHPECRLDYSSAIGVFCHCQWQIRGRLVQSSQCTAGNVLSAEFQLPSPIRIHLHQKLKVMQRNSHNIPRWDLLVNS